MGELGGNITPHIRFPVNPSSSFLPTSDPPIILPALDGSEVVNTGEVIITNFIDGEITNYNKIAHTVLPALDPSITESDITLARPLSIVPRSIEWTSQTRGRIAVLLSSASLVNKVMLAKTKRTLAFAQMIWIYLHLEWRSHRGPKLVRYLLMKHSQRRGISFSAI